MSPPLSISDIARVVMPREYPNGLLVMLQAFFDDTGTHDGSKWGPSKIVAVAGIFGTEGDLRGLESEWRKHLDRPLCGNKPRLKRFHMVDCQRSVGEFTGWSRTETNYFCHQLGTAIIESGVAGYGFASSRKDWDDLITGDARDVLGDSEGNCVRNCFIKAAAWAQHSTFDPHMSFVFDDRPHRQRENKVVYDVFKRQTMPPPELVGIFFATSHKILPLQAADLVAWEFYQHANDVLEIGFHPAKRAQFRRLVSNMRFEAQIARRDKIQMVADHANSHPRLADLADHFRTFDPDVPGETSEEQPS
jgi:hypothetical protein